MIARILRRHLDASLKTPLFALLVVAIVSSAAEAQPSGASIATWKVTERWRVDGTEAGDGFGEVRDLVVLRDQTLWVLDFKEQKIWRYTNEGSPLTSLSREGSGPGELRNANGMALHADGSVWVNDPANARLTVFNSTGTFATQHVLPMFGYGYRWGGFYNTPSREIIDPTTVKRGESYVQIWRRVDNGGRDRGMIDVPTCLRSDSPRYTLLAPNRRSFSPYPFTSGGGLAATGRNAVWCAGPHSTNAILLPLEGRDTLARSSVHIPRIAVSKAERDEQLSAIRERISQFATNDFDAAKVPSHKPGIAGLSVDDDGRLWIQHTGVYKRNATVYDVHDAQGLHLARVTIPGKIAYGMPVKARGMSLWLAMIDNDELVSIVHYTLSK